MRAFTRPMWLESLEEALSPCQPMEAVPLRRRSAALPAEPGFEQGSVYDEAWLQRLIQRHPALLPIEVIEPAFWPLTPVCMELPVASGFIDNLMLTPGGGIVLVEVKLWRNPEARREVVGQVLDYAKDLSGLDYEGLQTRVRQARKEPGADLFRLVSHDADEFEEAAFVDAVNRNLRLGRFLVLICGDGISEGAEHLTEFLQRYLGLHFTLALVEMSLWRQPGREAVLVQPRILARTLQIERAVVRVEDGVSLRPVDVQPAASSGARPVSLTEEAFFEALCKVDPALPGRLKQFLEQVQPLGVYAEARRNLSLKWGSPDGRSFHLGSISLDGQIATDFVQWSADTIGRLDIGSRYQQALAAMLPGGSVRRTPKETGWRVVVGSANPSIAMMLDRAPAWIAAIEALMEEVRDALAREATT